MVPRGWWQPFRTLDGKCLGVGAAESWGVQRARAQCQGILWSPWTRGQSTGRAGPGQWPRGMTRGPGEECRGGLGLVLQFAGGPRRCVVQGGVPVQDGGWGPFGNGKEAEESVWGTGR